VEPSPHASAASITSTTMSHDEHETRIAVPHINHHWCHSSTRPLHCQNKQLSVVAVLSTIQGLVNCSFITPHRGHLSQASYLLNINLSTLSILNTIQCNKTFMKYINALMWFSWALDYCTRNSSGDEIANVNFLYDIVHVL